MKLIWFSRDYHKHPTNDGKDHKEECLVDHGCYDVERSYVVDHVSVLWEEWRGGG